VTLDRKIESFGSLQWDGKYMTVADFGANVIYRFAPSEDAAGTVVGATELPSGHGSLTQTWIAGDHVVAAGLDTRGVCTDACRGSVNVFHYPQASLLSKNIGGAGDFQDPRGVAVIFALDPPK
jgi:hypothetical protein